MVFPNVSVRRGLLPEDYLLKVPIRAHQLIFKGKNGYDTCDLWLCCILDLSQSIVISSLAQTLHYSTCTLHTCICNIILCIVFLLRMIVQSSIFHTYISIILLSVAKWCHHALTVYMYVHFKLADWESWPCFCVNGKFIGYHRWILLWVIFCDWPSGTCTSCYDYTFQKSPHFIRTQPEHCTHFWSLVITHFWSLVILLPRDRGVGDWGVGGVSSNFLATIVWLFTQ